MKRVVPITLVAVAALLLAPLASAGVTSLRGGHAMDAAPEKPGTAKVVETEGGVTRTFDDQPPLIPHKIDKEVINLKTNTCLKCHSEKNYKKEKAPKIGDSHYVDAGGNKEAGGKMNMRRWMCNQCHATQGDGKPLVANSFQGLPLTKK